MTVDWELVADIASLPVRGTLVLADGHRLGISAVDIDFTMGRTVVLEAGTTNVFYVTGNSLSAMEVHCLISRMCNGAVWHRLAHGALPELEIDAVLDKYELLI